MVPRKLFEAATPYYHRTMALLGALVYRFPSRKITVIAVTGTKGKSTTTELINAILEEAGRKTALTNTVRFKIGKETWDNTYKMSMPGRFFMQKFLRKAVKAGCTHAILEMTSQGAIQYRHKHIDLDALAFTNLAPEHIEAHGSYEAYRDAKLSLGKALAASPKERKIMVSNVDDAEGGKFLSMGATENYPYGIKDAEPVSLTVDDSTFTYKGVSIHSPLAGVFNVYNMLAAAKVAESQGIDVGTIKRALEKFAGVAGRMQKIEAGQDFTVIVDNAHTPDSLEKVYQVFQDRKRICVLGNAGGGRDSWKRKDMAEIAERHCDHVILTDEDPYDEDPRAIVDAMAKHIGEKPLDIIMDRRQAIAKAVSLASTGDAVLITGKGTDLYIMRAKGAREPWSDAEVAKEEILKALRK
jgi:UDP-N-acetylmuramoyl-L-alanyl-D-glutamate--2,6-diaminopimelate ligase